MDDYRARFKSWKCPIRGELTVERHPWSIEFYRAAQAELQDKMWKSQMAALERQSAEHEVQRLKTLRAEYAKPKTGGIFKTIFGGSLTVAGNS